MAHTEFRGRERRTVWFVVFTGVASVVVSGWCVVIGIPTVVFQPEVRFGFSDPIMGTHSSIVVCGAICLVVLIIHSMKDKTLSILRRFAWWPVMGSGIGLVIYWFYRVYRPAVTVVDEPVA